MRQSKSKADIDGTSAMRATSYENLLPGQDFVEHRDLMQYINRYKQVNLLREIENRFSAASYLQGK